MVIGPDTTRGSESNRDMTNCHYFMHLSTGKLFNLLKRGYPSKVSKKIWQPRQTMPENCHHCSKNSVPPFIFRASIPHDKIIFNRELSIELIWVNRKPVIYIYILHRKWIPKRNIYQRKFSRKPLDRLYQLLESFYIGFPKIIRVDKIASFTCYNFVKTLKISGSNSNSAEWNPKTP